MDVNKLNGLLKKLEGPNHMYEEIRKDLEEQYRDFPRKKAPLWGLALKGLIDEKKGRGDEASIPWLSKRTGINAKHLFNILAQRVKDPSADKLVKIAEAFGMSFPEFAGRAISEHPASLFVTGFGQRGYIEYNQHGFSIQSLSPPGSGARDFFMGIMNIKPLKELKRWKFHEHSIVCIFVESGTLELTFGNQTKRIHSNESVYFDGGIPHKLRNIDTIEAKLLLVTRPPLH
jgi:mannose-6-phosphate isomerase-like protein (cupin superfamily)